MATEPSTTELMERLRGLQEEVATLKKQKPLMGPYRFAVLNTLWTFGAVFGLMAYFGPGFGMGPTLLDAHAVDASTIKTEKIYFTHEQGGEYKGSMDGYFANISLTAEDGSSVSVSPAGILIHGPKGTLRLVPSKAEE